jgi:hypothetical protein
MKKTEPQRFKELDKLLEQTQQIHDLEQHIDRTIEDQKRNLLIRELDEAFKLLEKLAEKIGRTENIREENLLVNSDYLYWTRKGNPVEGYLTTVAPDTMVIDIVTKGLDQLAIDNPRTHITYLTEYRERYRKLIHHIEKGELSEFYEYEPQELLYMINGYFGELLPAIGVDPRNSPTYKKLTELHRSHTQEEK